MSDNAKYKCDNLSGIKPALQAVTVRTLVIASAASIFSSRKADMLQIGRTKRVAARARQAAMYFAHVILTVSMTRTGHFFARDRTTARHACLQVEERREDARFDRALDHLEPAMKLWLARFSPILQKSRRKKRSPLSSKGRV